MLVRRSWTAVLQQPVNRHLTLVAKTISTPSLAQSIFVRRTPSSQARAWGFLTRFASIAPSVSMRCTAASTMPGSSVRNSFFAISTTPFGSECMYAIACRKALRGAERHRGRHFCGRRSRRVCSRRTAWGAEHDLHPLRHAPPPARPTNRRERPVVPQTRPKAGMDNCSRLV
jgi:hypothetical protein